MEKRQKLLIVDDDRFLLGMYAKKFMESGFDVMTLEDAKGDFVDKVAEFKPELISLDILMPERNGFEALTLLKKDPRTKDIPVIFLTNLSDEGDIKMGLELGAVDYVIASLMIPSELVTLFSTFLRDPKHYKPLHKK